MPVKRPPLLISRQECVRPAVVQPHIKSLLTRVKLIDPSDNAAYPVGADDAPAQAVAHLATGFLLVIHHPGLELLRQPVRGLSHEITIAFARVLPLD